MTVVRYGSVYHYIFYDHLKSFINNFTKLKQVPLELENIMYKNVINTHFTLCLYSLDGELDGEP